MTSNRLSVSTFQVDWLKSQDLTRFKQLLQPTVNILSLIGRHVTREYLSGLGKVLQGSNISKLLLANNELGIYQLPPKTLINDSKFPRAPFVVIKQIAEFASLLSKSNLDYLDLSNNHLDKELLCTLVSNLQNPRLTHLCISRNNLDAKGIGMIIEECPTNIKYLDISDNNVADGNFYAILPALAKSSITKVVINGISVRNRRKLDIVTTANRDKLAKESIPKVNP